AGSSLSGLVIAGPTAVCKRTDMAIKRLVVVCSRLLVNNHFFFSE
ncbi:MAG: hypothetical protein ACI9TP_001838, partial [Candidatus Azotimanducaceae bacterium]